ncbi:MAG: helix-turn-helix transcriptional regulator [Cyclobacteriaceae bacterium]
MAKKNSKRISQMQGFGSRLKMVMTYHSLSQTALSKVIGLTQPEISYFIHEKIKPRPIIRQRLAYLLEVDYNWFAWGKGKLQYYHTNYPIEQFHESFSERFVFIMWWNEKNLEDFCEELKVSATAIQYLMEGTREPTISIISDVCKWLGVEMKWLAPELSEDSNSGRHKLSISEIKHIHSRIIDRERK